jgi:hypothetical protein
MAITVDKANIGTFTADAAANTIALVTNQAIAAGALIVVAAGDWATNAELNTISDNSGNGYTWSVDKSGAAGAGAEHVFLGSTYATNGLASGTTITFTFADATPQARAAGGISFLGVKSTSYVDGTPLGPTVSATTAWDSGNATLAAGSVIVGANFQTGFTANAAAVGTEAFEAYDVPDTYGVACVYQIGTSAGTYNVSGTLTGAGNSQNIAVAYLAAAGGAAPGPVPHKEPAQRPFNMAGGRR